jgi:hypothetical protein
MDKVARNRHAKARRDGEKTMHRKMHRTCKHTKEKEPSLAPKIRCSGEDERRKK